MFWNREEAKRLSHIANVLFRHHLGTIINQLRLRGHLPFDKRLDTKRFKKRPLTPELLRNIFEELDGSFIKLGQLLSLRPDLIPAEYCEELAKLQDSVTPFSGDLAVKIVEQELGKPIRKLFKTFNKKPEASASMGQVHAAVLHDGKKVAVKIQRPGIAQTVTIDIKLLKRLAKVIEKRYHNYDLNINEIIKEFERYTHNELNYEKEAHNIDIFHNNFRGSTTISVPEVMWSHTKGMVLTTQYVEGKRLTHLDKFTKQQKKTIFGKIINAYFKQVFIDGIFHGDPHPGNFMIRRNGRVAILDFGIVGHLDIVLQDELTNFFIGLVKGDVAMMVDSAMMLGITNEYADLAKIRREVYDHLSVYHSRLIKDVKISRLFREIIDLFRENHLKVQPEFILLVKMVVTLESLGETLDPNVDFVGLSKPFMIKMAKERASPKSIAKRAERKATAMLKFAQSLPKKTNRFLDDFHDADTGIRHLDNDIKHLTTEIDRSSNRITLGFLAGTLFIASTILLPYQNLKVFGVPLLSFIGYITALIVLLAIFVSIIREKV